MAGAYPEREISVDRRIHSHKERRALATLARDEKTSVGPKLRRREIHA